MSLTQGLVSPRTPLRRFLGRELSAGARPLRATYRARLPASPLILPGEGVGHEAGTVGTAIDQRLRLAFTCAAPVDAVTMIGIDNIPVGHAVWEAIETVGRRLIGELASTVTALWLDDRTQPMARADDEEEHLARMLLAAAWYALNCRNPFAFPDTPLCKTAFAAPKTFTLQALLEVPHRHLVDDMLAQLHAAADGPLAELRATTTASQCWPGPTFEGSAQVSADADLIADGTLIDIKSTRRVHDFSLQTVLQLLGYALMDYTDQYKIEAVGVYLSRAGTLITWPLEDYLALLGARRRDLTELRAAFAALLGYTGCRADDDPLPEQERGVDRLLAELAPAIGEGCCRVCAQPLPAPVLAGGRRRLYCSPFCRQRSATLRYHGWLD